MLTELRYMPRMSKGLFLILSCFYLFSCSFTFMPERNDMFEVQPPFSWADEMYESEELENGTTKTIFKTNDTNYLTTEGTTIWTVWEETSRAFTSRTVSAAKSSGYSSGGYGIIFCHGEYELDGRKVHAMLVVMINNEGQYIIGKAVGGVFTAYGWWKNTSYLNRIPGSLNEITVFYDDLNNEYCLRINNFEIDRFSDNNTPPLRSGKNGYITVVTPYENFPSTGIDVYYIEER